MQIRCIKCHGTFRLLPGRIRPGSRIACTECGALHAPRGRVEAFSDPLQHDETVRLFAEASGLDIPSANAVLLGMISLQQARELGESPIDRPRPATPRPAVRPTAPCARFAEQPKTVQEGVSGSRAILLVALSLLISTAVGSYGLRSWRKQIELGERVAASSRASTAPPENRGGAASAVPVVARGPALPPNVKVERNSSGDVIGVHAATPLGVLGSFCSTYEPPGACEPVEVAKLRPARVGRHLGVYRDLSRRNELFAIRIVRDRTTRLWKVWNNGRPLESFRPEPDRLGERIDARRAP